MVTLGTTRHAVCSTTRLPHACSNLAHLFLVTSKAAFVLFDHRHNRTFYNQMLLVAGNQNTLIWLQVHTISTNSYRAVSELYQTSHWRSSTTHVIVLVAPVRAVLRLVSSVICATWIAKPIIATAHVSTTTAALSSWNTAAATTSVVCQSTGRLDTLVHRRRFAGCTRCWRRLADKWSCNHIHLLQLARSVHWLN